jgi:DNA-directed RNA polymerase specialized sigma subunit
MDNLLYKKTEKWLYNLDALRERIKNLKVYYEEVEMDTGCGGIDYSKDKISQTYKFNSSTENLAEKLADISRDIKKYENRVTMLECGFNILNTTERIIIQSKYFDNEPWYNIAYKMKYSERQCRYIRSDAIEKLSIALFGE